MCPLMSDPLTNFTTPPKLVLGIARAKIITNRGEALNEDDDYSNKKQNPIMP